MTKVEGEGREVGTLRTQENLVLEKNMRRGGSVEEDAQRMHIALFLWSL